jgi:hypothetical protein
VINETQLVVVELRRHPLGLENALVELGAILDLPGCAR